MPLFLHRTTIVSRRLSRNSLGGTPKEKMDAKAATALAEVPDAMPEDQQEILQCTRSLITAINQGNWNLFQQLCSTTMMSVLPGRKTEVYEVIGPLCVSPFSLSLFGGPPDQSTLMITLTLIQEWPGRVF